MADARPMAEPTLQHRQGLKLAWCKRLAVAPRRRTIAVPRHAAHPLVKREISLFLGQGGNELGKCSENGEADAPTIPIPSPKQHGISYEGAMVYTLADKAQHCL